MEPGLSSAAVTNTPDATVQPCTLEPSWRECPGHRPEHVTSTKDNHAAHSGQPEPVNKSLPSASLGFARRHEPRGMTLP
jgi:hypothetical protein